jgi:hypothetical protein
MTCTTLSGLEEFMVFLSCLTGKIYNKKTSAGQQELVYDEIGCIIFFSSIIFKQYANNITRKMRKP